MSHGCLMLVDHPFKAAAAIREGDRTGRERPGTEEL
jgi:hypothetical protein